MVIAYEKVQRLFKAIATAVPDQLDCDGCFELSAELADAEIHGQAIDSVLDAVRIHMNQCPCCAYEYQALLEALRTADDR